MNHGNHFDVIVIGGGPIRLVLERFRFFNPSDSSTRPGVLK